MDLHYTSAVRLFDSDPSSFGENLNACQPDNFIQSHPPKEGGSERHQISIIGAGSWGCALALTLARLGGRVTLWGHNPKNIEEIKNARTNTTYLPGIVFPENIYPTTELTECHNAEVILFVIPSKFVRTVATSLTTGAPFLKSVIVSCTKGIEPVTGKLMSEVLSDTFPTSPIAVLSGPNLAGDVAKGLPAAGVIGCNQESLLPSLQKIFYGTNYRAYTSNDMRGIQLGGALKNIFAITAGVSDGLGMGENAKAGLVTRALAEMTRLGVAMGGNRKTFCGLSGIGDLMATCFSQKSRNYHVGQELSRGRSSHEIQSSMTMVAEGIITARSAQECARRLNIETPIIDEVVAVLDHGKSPAESIKELLGRRLRSEEEI